MKNLLCIMFQSDGVACCNRQICVQTLHFSAKITGDLYFWSQNEILLLE